MQLFFATVLAVAGAFTSASSSIFGWMGSLWDRTQALGPAQVHEAANGFMRRRPSAVVLCSHTDLNMREQEMALFGRLVAVRCSNSRHEHTLSLLCSRPDFDPSLEQWNHGMIPDMLRSHQIDAATAARLAIGGKEELTDDLHWRGPRQMPDLQKLAAELCYDARRRVRDLLSYAPARDTGMRRPVPSHPMPSHPAPSRPITSRPTSQVCAAYQGGTSRATRLVHALAHHPDARLR
jgi:hypothetical protein